MNEEALTFKIYTQNGNYNHDDIDAGLIKDIIMCFEAEYNDFIVVEPSVPIGDSIYMQAIPSPDNPDQVTVELRLQYTETSFKHYCYQAASQNEAISLFLDYWALQKLPDWTSWRDMTDEF